MKRSPLKRKTRLTTRTPLKKEGATKAKREKRTAQWRRSAEYKALRAQALERAGNRCEEVVKVVWCPNGMDPLPLGSFRCPETQNLHMHEIRYTGKLKDVQILCAPHHMALEAEIRPWNVGKLGRKKAG